MLAATGRRKRARRPRFYSTQYREYDPALGRFHAIDPMASKFATWTPYMYGYNDPVNANDPDGAQAAWRNLNNPVPIEMQFFSQDPIGGSHDAWRSNRVGLGSANHWSNKLHLEAKNYNVLAQRMSNKEFFVSSGITDIYGRVDKEREEEIEKEMNREAYAVTTDDGVIIYLDKSFHEDFKDPKDWYMAQPLDVFLNINRAFGLQPESFKWHKELTDANVNSAYVANIPFGIMERKGFFDRVKRTINIDITVDIPGYNNPKVRSRMAAKSANWALRQVMSNTFKKPSYDEVDLVFRIRRDFIKYMEADLQEEYPGSRVTLGLRQPEKAVIAVYYGSN
ncbi:RHS repeat-associated core domain-containing protein [Roseivirga sp. BDSF3-8]|uniref:RHS repeat-associated core domain-containing protein n=1 Tax=Roseivirga sp. BDSF3-8 TaxID=3241598 RepID=UPI0035327485